jgi:hypothetical protein
VETTKVQHPTGWTMTHGLNHHFNHIIKCIAGHICIHNQEILLYRVQMQDLLMYIYLMDAITK